MARNSYPGTCCDCGKQVAVGAGFFQRFKGRWIIHHRRCSGTNRNWWPNGMAIIHTREGEEQKE